MDFIIFEIVYCLSYNLLSKILLKVQLMGHQLLNIRFVCVIDYDTGNHFD